MHQARMLCRTERLYCSAEEAAHRGDLLPFRKQKEIPMSIITLDRSPVSGTKAPTATGRGFWARFLDRMIEARQRRAMEQICRHYRFALPRELDTTLSTNNGRNENSLPFER